jgi:hypothetical protein
VPDADDDEDDLGPDHDDDDSESSEEPSQIWPIVIVSLLGVLSILLCIILACFWRQYWVSDVMWSTPVFSPGPNPVSLGKPIGHTIVVNSPSAIERLLLYKILESTFSKKKTN